MKVHEKHEAKKRVGSQGKSEYSPKTAEIYSALDFLLILC